MDKAKLSDICLVSATIEEYDFYYNLKCEESNIYWTGHDKKPDYNSFKNWYVDNVLSKKLSFYIIKWRDVNVGAIYYNMVSNDFCNYLGLAITEKVQGKGIATLAVTKFIEHIRMIYPDCTKIGFYIREDNTVSQNIHKKLGCVKTGETEELYLASEKKNIIMDYWQLLL